MTEHHIATISTTLSTRQGHLSVIVAQPQAGVVVNSGDTLHVSGAATGTGGAEPVGIDSVTVTLAGVSVEASLTRVGHTPVASYTFEADLTVPGATGAQDVVAIAHGDDGAEVQASVSVDVEPVVVVPPPPPPPAGWATSALAPAGSLSATPRLAAIAKPVGCELWWIGADGAVTGVWFEPGSPWQSYQLAGPGSAASGGSITAVSKGGDQMEVWWIGPDGSVQAAYHDGSWNRYALADAGSAAVTGSIAAVWKYDDVMEVWWTGPDGSVQAAYHDGSWNRYVLAGAGSAALTGAIAAVAKGGDVMEVWWTGPDGSVQAAYHQPTWNYYALAGPGSASTTCRISAAFGGTLTTGLMRVWWVDGAGGATQAFFDGQWSTTPIGTGANPSGAAVGVLFNPDTPTVFLAAADGSLADAYPPEITMSVPVHGGRGLRGTVWLTLREDGSTRWHGDVTNDEPYGYDFGLSVFARTSGHADLGAAHQGSVAGWGEPGSSNDIWDEEHDPNPMLAHGTATYRFGALAIRLEHSVDLLDYLKAAVDGIFEAALGTVLVVPGALIVVGIEVASVIGTGSLVPGAVIAGGVPWLTGPAGVFVRAIVTATNTAGRTLTEEEYAWANDAVFKGALPPRDTFQITNYVGAEDRPFTFPTFGGPTLVNLGDARFNDIHSDEQTVIHELTHVCQIAHTQDLIFTVTAIVTQITNEFTDVYDYGAAGFDYTDLGIEAQAEVVEDWFRGRPAQAMTPDPRNHTGIPMDAQSPYYRYITDNVRTGRF